MTIEDILSQLDAEHYPDPELKGRGGCVMCWPKDGSWPCTTRLIADELRAGSDLLTDDERKALRLSGKLVGLLHGIIGDGMQSANDWAEMAGHIHVIQRAIGAQAAARAYPGEFRLLGKSLATS